MTKKLCALILVFLMIFSLVHVPAFSATVGSLEYHSTSWQGKNWLLADMYTSADGTKEGVSYINEDDNLVVRSVDGINTRVIAKYPDSVKANGTPNDYDSENVINFMDEKEFDVNFRMKFDNRFTVMIRCYHTAVRLNFREAGTVRYDDGNGNYHTVGLQTNNDWHDYTIKVRGQNCSRISPRQCLAHARVFMDGKEVFDYCTEQYYPAAYRSVMFYADYNYDFSSMAEIAYCDIVDKHTSTQILAPLSGTKFASGQDITLTADAGAGTGEEKVVEFYIGNVKVGSDVDKEKSNASVTLSGLKRGTYVATAISDGITSADISFTVTDDVHPTVNQGGDYSVGDKVTVKTYGIDTIDASKVEYYLDGKLVASSMEVGVFRGTFYAQTVGSHSIWAKIYTSDGEVYESDISSLNINAGSSENFDFDTQYMADYTLSGGVGSVFIDDGFFALSLVHSGNEVSYTDSDGTIKQYQGVLGDGSYRIVTTSGSAEVYYNGQFAFSLLMPRSNGTKAVTHSGVEGFSFGSSGVKGEILSGKTDSSGKASRVLPNFGLYYSFEFEKTDTATQNILVCDGTFEVGLNFTDDGIYANHQPENGSAVEKFKLADSFAPGYYRITVGHGMAQLFCNNVITGTFRCPMKTQRPSVFVTSEKSGDYYCLRYADDIYYHFEDFEGNNEEGFCAGDYWYSESDAVIDSELPDFSHEIVNIDGENSLSLKGEGDYLLNAITNNGTLKWRGCVNGDKGKIWIVFRHSYLCEYNKMVFDLETKKWSLVQASRVQVSEYDTEDSDGDGDTTEVLRTYYAPNEVVLAETNFISDDEWHDFELVTNEENVTLWCDGKKIIESSDVRKCFGRFGFGGSGATFVIDDVDYAGCGKANAGLSFMTDAEFDFYQNFNDQILMVGSYGNTKYHVSDDNGVTWNLVSYDGKTSIGARSANNLRLLSGKFLRTIMSGKYTYAHLYDPAQSTNTEVTPANSKGSLIEPQGMFDTVPYSCMPARLMQVQSGPYKGRVFFCRGGSDEVQGKTFMFYTDDYIDPNFNGKATWHQPNIQPSYLNMGVNVQESQMVDMPDGSLRYYMRTDRGTMYYLVSQDGGETWDVSDYKTENLISPLCCYSIQRVGDTSTYYAFWEYDTVTSNHVWTGMPRNRRALAVSYDGMKTWQYVADIEEDGYGPGSSKTNCNHGMRVVNGAVYMSYYCMSNLHKMYRQDISKVKSLMRFTALHYREPGYISANTLLDEYCAIPLNGGNALVYGGYREVLTNENGFVDVKTFGACIGATTVQSGDTVKFILGSGVAIFSSGSAEYTMDGQKYMMDEVCFENGYMNPKALARVFAKHLHITENSIVVSNAPLSEGLVSQAERMAIGENADSVFMNAFTDDVNEASRANSPEEIRRTFDVYGNFSDGVLPDKDVDFSLMDGSVYGGVGDISKICDVLKNSYSEKNGNYVFSTSYGKFENFASLGGNAVLQSDNEVRLTWKKGVDTGFKYRLFTDAPDDYIMSFDFKPELLGGSTNIHFGNGVYKGRITLDNDSVVLSGDGYSKINCYLANSKWYRLKLVISSDGCEKFEICDIDTGGIIASDTVFLCIGSVKGVIFENDCRDDCAISVKSLRLYETMFFDVVSYSAKDGVASAEIEVVAASKDSDSGNVIMAVYDGEKLAGICATKENVLRIRAYGTKKYVISPFSYSAESGAEPTVKFFYWKNLGDVVPILESVEVR